MIVNPQLLALVDQNAAHRSLPRPEALACAVINPGYGEGWPAMYVASLVASGLLVSSVAMTAAT